MVVTRLNTPWRQVEIKNTIKNLKKEAEMRLTLDVEAQQSFDFLSDQVHGLRKAFSTLSDVLIEEVDLIRSEANDRNEELEQRIEAMSKAHRTMKTELTLQRSEAQTARAAATTKSAAVEERLELMQVPALPRNAARCTPLPVVGGLTSVCARSGAC